MRKLWEKSLFLEGKGLRKSRFIARRDFFPGLKVSLRDRALLGWPIWRKKAESSVAAQRTTTRRVNLQGSSKSWNICSVCSVVGNIARRLIQLKVKWRSLWVQYRSACKLQVSEPPCGRNLHKFVAKGGNETRPKQRLIWVTFLETKNNEKCDLKIYFQRPFLLAWKSFPFSCQKNDSGRILGSTKWLPLHT